MQEVSLDRLIALVALAGTYLGLALGRLPVFRVDRTGVAIIGGAVVVVTYRSAFWNTARWACR